MWNKHFSREWKKRWIYTAPFAMCTRGQKKCGKMKMKISTNINTTSTAIAFWLHIRHSQSPHIHKGKGQSEHRVQMATQPTICYALLGVLRTEYVGVWWQAKTIPQSDMCVYKKRNMPLNIAHIKPIKSRSWDKHILVSSDLGSLPFLSLYFPLSFAFGLLESTDWYTHTHKSERKSEWDESRVFANT